MAGGKGKINEYNQSLTPEQRKRNAKKAASAKRPGLKLNSDIKKIVRTINEAPAGRDIIEGLAMLNVDGKNMSNAAGIALSLYQSAINGDPKAIEKWQKMVGQFDKDEGTDGDGVNIIIDV